MKTTTPTALRISEHVYDDDEPTGDMDLLGVISLENGALVQRPEPGKAAALRSFIKNYRDYGVGPEQSDEEFLAQLPHRVKWHDGLAEEVKQD